MHFFNLGKSFEKKCTRVALLFLVFLILSTSLASAADSRLSKLSTRQDVVDSTDAVFPESDTVDPGSDLGQSKASIPPESSLSSSSSNSIIINTALAPSSNSTTIINGGANSTHNNITINPQQLASRLSITKPKPSQMNPPLFPIGGQVDFEWSFDDSTLVSPPQVLTLDINMVSDPTKVWPLANLSGTSTKFTWDTTSVKDNVLFTGIYTLNIYDANSGKEGMIAGGHLVPSSDLRFGLYIPGSNISQNDEKYCATCRFIGSANGRVGNLDRAILNVPWLIGAIIALANL